jgi:hypothetical protein
MSNTRKLPSYRAFYVGPAGVFLNSVHLCCTSDGDAIKLAGQLARHSEIELWRGANRIARLERALVD